MLSSALIMLSSRCLGHSKEGVQSVVGYRDLELMREPYESSVYRLSRRMDEVVQRMCFKRGGKDLEWNPVE